MERTHRYILSLKIRRSSLFVTIATMTLICSALLGSCDKLDLAQNTNVSPESNTGTQTWAAYTLETITPTKPPTTNTPTLPPPTETPTVTPTQTPSPTPTPEIPYLIAQFGLNPDRQYTFVITENGTRYLRDEHNQALMLKYIVVEEAGQLIGGWVDTSLEEKYGHLVPINQRLMVADEVGYGNLDGSNHIFDENYSTLIIVAWSTGDVWTETTTIPSLGEVVIMRGKVIYRNSSGNIEVMNVVLNVSSLSRPEFMVGVCVDDSGSYGGVYFCGLSGGLQLTDGAENLLDDPGRAMRFRITYQRPNIPPPIYETDRYSNINSRATYLMDRSLWPEIAQSLLHEGTNPHPEVELGVSQIHLYLTWDEYSELYETYPLPPLSP